LVMNIVNSTPFQMKKAQEPAQVRAAAR
jgi:hypothetical protein